MKSCWLAIILICALYGNAGGIEKPPHISHKVWHRTSLYMLTDEHPAKPILDRIFSSSRAIFNVRSMRKAGFINPKVRQWTHIIVTKHPDLPGYIFKTFLDVQRYHNNEPEYKRWVTRIKGARAIQAVLDEKGWNDWFKVPKKWIYALPEHPRTPDDYLPKNFILFEEDMDLLSKEENKAAWKSGQITEERLDALYYILRKLGFNDCIKPDNLPFSHDGKIAFIDTDSYKKGQVQFHKLTKHLPLDMQLYWLLSTAQ